MHGFSLLNLLCLSQVYGSKCHGQLGVCAPNCRDPVFVMIRAATYPAPVADI